MRRLRRTAPLFATVLAAGLTATACGSTSDKATGTPAPPASSAPSHAPSAPGGAADSGGIGGGGIAASAPCKTSGLTFAVAPGSGTQQEDGRSGDRTDAQDDVQHEVVINLTNKSTAPCTLNGYPGVDLVGAPTDTLPDGTWSLARETTSKPRSTTLQPKATASFSLTYLPYSAQGNAPESELRATKLVITPPNETHSATLPWEFGPVLLQDGATHPGTHVGPIGPMKKPRKKSSATSPKRPSASSPKQPGPPPAAKPAKPAKPAKRKSR
ncbi:DUF4232 domain-containing protein [Streptomyces sp. NPDC051561]|uniref:DUF4232 domain-containing protein n=1 Tax=Streptomyces sp. NPDC051561 TaxID=3365658 RepID=UPI0037B97723